jgi:hypothetical protein
MSSTKQHQTRHIYVESALATLVACVTCAMSLTFSPSVEAHQATIEDEPVVTEGNVEAAVVVAAAAAYGWLANKTYDLGKEVGKSLAGPKQTSDSQPLADAGAEYLLD